MCRGKRLCSFDGDADRLVYHYFDDKGTRDFPSCFSFSVKDGGAWLGQRWAILMAYVPMGV